MFYSKTVRETKGDKIFNICNNIILFIVFALVAYPIIFVVSASFSSPESLMAGKVWLLPVKPTLEGYKVVLHYTKVWSGFGNSVYYTLVGTVINIFFTVIAAYPLSRKDFWGREVIAFIFAFTMWFSGGLIPSYLLMKSLHLVDNRWVMIIPGAISVWNVIITRTYFQNSIPHELFESARIDGCDDFTYLWKIVLPLSRPIIAVITLYYAVSHWNSFFTAFIYLQRQELFPLQIVLREVLIQNTAQDMVGDLNTASQRELMAEILKYSLIIISSLPVIIIYPFIQKHFVKGIMVGSVKG